MEGVQEKSSLLMLVASSEAENEPLSVQETEIQEKNIVMELQLDTARAERDEYSVEVEGLKQSLAEAVTEREP